MLCVAGRQGVVLDDCSNGRWQLLVRKVVTALCCLCGRHSEVTAALSHVIWGYALPAVMQWVVCQTLFGCQCAHVEGGGNSADLWKRPGLSTWGCCGSITPHCWRVCSSCCCWVVLCVRSVWHH
jgi:hypothetical protein